MNTESASVIKRRLQKTWFYFFNRFGHLSPVQEAVIPKVLEGKNLIVCSPTASGKTEAIVAPVVERLLKDDIGGLKVLYITPTRALANDLFIRLNEPLLNLGIKLRVKTGDKPFFNSKDPPNFIITTPESFDSLLCRYSQAFNGLKFIIIDELHLLDCNYRGDQLRVLLERLRSKITQVNYYMMSATLKEPKETARRYCDNAEIIVVEGKKRNFSRIFEYK
jgi:ATP-dependent Lhr-like helicase